MLFARRTKHGESECSVLYVTDASMVRGLVEMTDKLLPLTSAQSFSWTRFAAMKNQGRPWLRLTLPSRQDGQALGGMTQTSLAIARDEALLLLTTLHNGQFIMSSIEDKSESLEFAE
jgi:hypothetical protein